jgi:hypothetical protein
MTAPTPNPPARKPWLTRLDGKRAQCTWLNSGGVRCRRFTSRWEAVTEDAELSNYRWFYVPVCALHAERSWRDD